MTNRDALSHYITSGEMQKRASSMSTASNSTTDRAGQVSSNKLPNIRWKAEMRWRNYLIDMCSVIVNSFAGRRIIGSTRNDVSIDIEHETSQSSGMRSLGFYQLLNIGTKFIRMHGGRRFLSPINNILTFALMYFMAFDIFYCVSGLFVVSLPHCGDYTPEECFALRVECYLTLGFTLNGLFSWMMAMSFCVTLAGIYYGARIAHELAGLWIERFGPLRRVSVADCVVVARAQHAVDASHTPSNESEIDNRNRDDDSLSRDFQILRHLRRDATETFFFRQEFVRQVSRIWGPYLFLLITLSVIFEALYLLVIATDSQSTPIYIVLVYFAFQTAIYAVPMFSLAYANETVEKLHAMMTGSRLEDYEVIGGREQWTEAIDSTAVWSIMEVRITCKSTVVMHAYV